METEEFAMFLNYCSLGRVVLSFRALWPIRSRWYMLEGIASSILQNVTKCNPTTSHKAYQPPSFSASWPLGFSLSTR